ncbi:MAG TPA: DUF6152 family protein [Hyphomonadaceae bacterium]|nr:DUF6152 family protein [Hyphomonadaceae bacterium]
MRIAVAALASLALAGAAIAIPAWAHHGWESYDASKQQKVTGKITELKWEQPHAVLWLDVNGKKTEVWLSPLQRMVDRGLSKEALGAGKTVTVEAQPSTKAGGEWKALAINVDGKDFNLMR